MGHIIANSKLSIKITKDRLTLIDQENGQFIYTFKEGLTQIPDRMFKGCTEIIKAHLPPVQLRSATN